MIRYRSFRNTDTPGLSELWRGSGAGRGLMQPMSADLWEQMVFAKPYFDRHGMIVADEEGKLVGCVHAAFGPTLSGDALCYQQGVICLLMVRPDFRRRGVASTLLQLAERYLLERGARQVFAGGYRPLNPFYLGLYGGSNTPGVLASVSGAAEFFTAREYESVHKVLVWERDLKGFEPPIDRRQLIVRRSTEVRTEDDPPARNWWEACVYGNLERERFDLFARPTNTRLASAMIWMLEPLSRSWGVRAAGLSELDVEPEHRRHGLATYLVGEICRRLRDQGLALIQAQCHENMVEVQGLYHKLGFDQSDYGILYCKSFLTDPPVENAAS